MATIAQDISERIGIALNEATLLDVQLDSLKATAKCTLSTLKLKSPHYLAEYYAVFES